MIDLLIALVLVFAAIFSATVAVLPPVSLTYLITACGILLTYRVARTQAKLAERKLFLDLMQRRADWYDRVKLALENRAEERRQHIETIVTQGEVPGNPVHLLKLHQLETEASWLFSPDMLVLMARLITAEKEVNDTQFEARQGNRDASMEVGNRVMALYEAQGKVQDYLSAYLYVGDIGKPKRSPVRFPKVRRTG
jgi:hypothetical protein